MAELGVAGDATAIEPDLDGLVITG